MRKTLFILFLAGFFIPFKISAQQYKKLHNAAIVADTHNDFISMSIEKGISFDQSLKGTTHSDMKRMLEGGIDILVFSIWCDHHYVTGRAFNWANREIDSVYAVVKRNPEKMMIVRTPEELKTAIKKKKLAAMIGVEGGHMIEDNIAFLDSLFNRGARYMTLTWNNSTSWASSAMDETQRRDSLPHVGLNDFGKQVVRRMNDLGMMVDISHVGEQTFYDALAISTKPVIASHSCAWTLSPVFRNMKDDQIKAIKKNNGVIQLNFYSAFVDSTFLKKSNAFLLKYKSERDSLLQHNPSEFFVEVFLFNKYREETELFRPALSKLIDHIDHIVSLAGIDHVGLGSDFDGISSAPQELDDVTNMPLITRELLKRGYSKKDIRKILGGNFIRVFKANSVTK